MKNNKIICHLTSVHTRYDIRIFHKECMSLKNSGYEVYLIVADGKGDEIKEGIHIIDVGKVEGRGKRMLKSAFRVYQKAKQIDAIVYHFHDPELLPYGYLLSLSGKKVIYDTHEDLPRQLLSKHYMNNVLKQVLSYLIEIFENFIARRLSGVIAATPYIALRFSKVNKNTLDINNFPLLHELNISEENEEGNFNKTKVCYTGGVTRIRGIEYLAKAAKELGIEVHIAGNFESENFKNEVLKDNKYLKVYGNLQRKQLRSLWNECLIGIVTFLPEPNHINAQPNKIFEYMANGLAIVASNFPLWKQVIEENNCGICVNPESVEDIAEAIHYLLNNPEQAFGMGQNGKKLVMEKYNWFKEELKLINYYTKIIYK